MSFRLPGCILLYGVFFKAAATLLFGLGMEKENNFDPLYVGISVVMSILIIKLMMIDG